MNIFILEVYATDKYSTYAEAQEWSFLDAIYMCNKISNCHQNPIISLSVIKNIKKLILLYKKCKNI